VFNSNPNELRCLVVDNTPEQLDKWCEVVGRVMVSPPETASSFQEAMSAIESATFDVLVIDLFLTPESEESPDLDRSEGLRLIKACREKFPESRIMAITSRIGSAEAGAAALLAGANDFISTQWPKVYHIALLQQKLSIFRQLVLQARG
jgi:CheY-like chemotaxis protein